MGLRTQSAIALFLVLPAGVVVCILLATYVWSYLGFLCLIPVYLVVRFLNRLRCPKCGFEVMRWQQMDNWQLIAVKCPKCGEEFD